jgi:ABC-type multidrug transport system fused ATPase/permease subunit
MVEATSAAGRIISERPDRTAEEENRQIVPLNSGPAAIDFQDVWFTYDGRSAPAIRGVTLQVSVLVHIFMKPRDGRLTFTRSKKVNLLRLSEPVEAVRVH